MAQPAIFMAQPAIWCQPQSLLVLDLIGTWLGLGQGGLGTKGLGTGFDNWIFELYWDLVGAGPSWYED